MLPVGFNCRIADLVPDATEEVFDAKYYLVFGAHCQITESHCYTKDVLCMAQANRFMAQANRITRRSMPTREGASPPQLWIGLFTA